MQHSLSSIMIGKNRYARLGYTLDEISLVPSNLTLDIDDVDINWSIKDYNFSIPMIASAMDAIVDIPFAIEMSNLGSFGVINLEGLQTRYEDPKKIIQQIADSKKNSILLLQELYKEPIKDHLVYQCVQSVKNKNAIAVASSTPIYANRLATIAKEADLDIFIIQSTITTLNHKSSKSDSFDFESFIKKMQIPIMLGNCVTYESAISFMEIGISGILVGIGPGAACTTRDVLGIGIPQATATIDVSAARDYYFNKTKNYVPVITDGGIRNSADIIKSIALGADAAMFGTLFAQCYETPAKGYQWGMATSSILPRGDRIHIGQELYLKELLFGPSAKTDGTQDLVRALKMSMASCGKQNLSELQKSEIVFSSNLKKEGKI